MCGGRFCFLIPRVVLVLVLKYFVFLDFELSEEYNGFEIMFI